MYYDYFLPSPVRSSRAAHRVASTNASHFFFGADGTIFYFIPTFLVKHR
jgi:hypothetical protein